MTLRDGTYAQAGSLPSDQSVLVLAGRHAGVRPKLNRKFCAPPRVGATHETPFLRGYVEKHAAHEMEHHAPPRVQGDQTGDVQAIVPPIFRYATMTLNRVSRRVTLPANSAPPPPPPLPPCLSSSLCNTFYRSTKLLSCARK